MEVLGNFTPIDIEITLSQALSALRYLIKKLNTPKTPKLDQKARSTERKYGKRGLLTFGSIYHLETLVFPFSQTRSVNHPPIWL